MLKQRKITKEEETVSVSSSFDYPSSIIRRAAANGKQWEILLVPSSICFAELGELHLRSNAILKGAV